MRLFMLSEGTAKENFHKESKYNFDFIYILFPSDPFTMF